MNGPVALAASTDGALYVSSAGPALDSGSIFRVYVEAHTATPVPGDDQSLHLPPLPRPHFFDVDANGWLVVPLEEPTQPALVRIALPSPGAPASSNAGSVIPEPSSITDFPLVRPTAVAVATSGEIYITDANLAATSGEIVRVDSEGAGTVFGPAILNPIDVALVPALCANVA